MGMIRAETLRPAADRQVQPVAAVSFDWIMVGLSAWLMLGAHLDAWAHIHVPVLETFFTPWHGVLYSGYAALTGFLVLTMLRNRAGGRSWKQVLPAGYHLALSGALIFALGGVGDLVWHTIFGIEGSLDALLSPTHLVLAVGAALMVSGPLRAAWLRSDVEAHLGGRIPEILSLTFMLALLGYMTQYAHPFGAVRVLPTGLPVGSESAFAIQALGLLSIMLQSGIFMGLVLAAVRRRPLPVGSLTLTFGLSVVLMTAMRTRLLMVEPSLLIGIGLVAGVASDLLLWVLRPSPARPTALQVFGFAVPTAIYTVYFLVLELTHGIAWTVHFTTGAIVLAGIVGWLLAYLVLPPAGREPQRS